MLTVLLVPMEKMMLAEIKKSIGLILLFVSFISNAETPIKKLYFQYNDKVVIWITNQPCIDKKINKEYPYIAMAIRSDGDAMPGCYKNVDDDIKIQWIGGDFSLFPANVFLIPLLNNNV